MSGEYIVGLALFPNPTDTTILIPFLERMKAGLNKSFRDIVADMGYASEENYTYLENNDHNAYLGEKNINSVRMIYGQSMGSEVGIELMHQLVQTGIHVDKAFFDGAPCIKLSKPYKTFMYFKFKTMIGMMRDKTIEEVMSWKFLKKFTNGDTESLRSLIAGCIEVAPYLTNQSIKAENECCYTFDYPAFSENEQQKMHFFYAKEEKAYKTCYKLVKTAYPNAMFKVVSGYGHMTYSVKNTEEYLQMLRNVCNVCN